MNVTVEDSGKCRKIIRVELPAERVREELDRVTGEYAQYARIPGFRPGKSPINLVRQRYQKEIIGAVKEQMLPKAYREALEQEKLDVVGVIDVQGGDIAPGQPVTFSLTVDTRPEINLPEYKGIPLTRKPVQISDTDIDAALTSIRERYAKFEDATDRAIAAGDLAQIDYSATVDGKKLEDIDPTAKGLGEGADFWVRVDENAFIPEFATVLPGRSIGDKVDVAVTFPPDFASEPLRGANATFNVVIKGIRQKVLPDLDEAFAKRVGEESLESLRKGVGEDLQRHASQSELTRLRNEIHQFLLGAVNAEMPESMVQSETQQIVRDILQQNLQRGATEDILREHAEEIHQGAAKSAVGNVKLRFILSRIAKEEGIKVGKDDIDTEIKNLSARYSQPVETIRKRIQENNSMDALQTDILVRKTTDRLLEIASISE